LSKNRACWSGSLSWHYYRHSKIRSCSAREVRMLVNATVRAASCAGDRSGLDCEGLSGTRCSFYAPAPVTLAHIQRLFPFDGTYHFRAKASGKSVGLPRVENVWVDLTDPRKEIAVPSGANELEILALALDLPAVSEEESTGDTLQYLEAVKQEMPQGERPKRQAIEPLRRKGGAGAGGAANMAAAVGDRLKTGVTDVFKKIGAATQKIDASNAANLWNSLAKHTLGIFGQSASVLSDQAESNLAELSDLLDIAFMPANKEHVTLLRDLFSCLFVGSDVAFSLTGDKWKEAGFQKADPTADLKQSGILALRSMLHMGLTHSKETQEMVQANKVNTKTKDPFAIVGVNITLLLAELLHLRDNKYMFQQGVGYWALFEDPSAYYEMFSLCFFHMNATWVQRQAVRADFGKLVSEVKEIVTRTLKRSPTNLNEFRLIGIDEGLVFA